MSASIKLRFRCDRCRKPGRKIVELSDLYAKVRSTPDEAPLEARDLPDGWVFKYGMDLCEECGHD